MGQSLRKVQTCLTVYRRLLLHRRNPSVVFAAAACCSEAWLTGRTSSRSPFLPSPLPMPSNPLSHEKLTWRHLHTQRPILAADWPGVNGPASGLPHQWRQRLRDSQGEDKLLHDTSPFSAPNSGHCIVFSFFFQTLLLLPLLLLRLSSFVLSL